MRFRFLLGLVIGGAAATLTLFHAGTVELALLRGSAQVSSALVHLLLIAFGLLIGWIRHDERETGRRARADGVGRDAA
jgi:hypothetical protein